MSNLNPSNFLDTMKDAQKKQSEHSQRNYELKILKKMVGIFDYTVGEVREAYSDERDEDPLSEVKYKSNNPELDVLHMRRLKNQVLTSFIYKVDPTMAWKTFCRLIDEYKLDTLGLVFPMKDQGDWIIHNMGLKCVHGCGHIVVPSKQTDLRDIVLEPLETFIKAREEI